MSKHLPWAAPITNAAARRQRRDRAKERREARQSRPAGETSQGRGEAKAKAEA